MAQALHHAERRKWIGAVLFPCCGETDQNGAAIRGWR
jgi:hypothetical protein